MRRKVAIALSLIVLVIVGTVLVDWWILPAEPPLRVGMTVEEVVTLLGKPDTVLSVWVTPDEPFRVGMAGEEVDKLSGNGPMKRPNGNEWTVLVYCQDTLFTGRKISVNCDNEHKVTSWEVVPIPRAEPSWLDNAMRATGW